MDPVKKEFANSLSGRHIAIFYPQTGFLTNPTLTCLAEELIACGVKLDVYSPTHDSAGRVNGVRRKVFPIPLKIWYGSRSYTFFQWQEWVARLTRGEKCNRENYDLVIGANSLGVIEAYKYSSKHGVPLVYLSFEIFFWDELKERAHLKEKKLEVQASQDAALIVVQDPVRGNLFARENKLDPGKFIFMPVAPRSEKRTLLGNVIRNRSAIPDKNFIVLHTGSFRSWTYAQEILESSSRWPDDITLYIHTPGGMSGIRSQLPTTDGGAQIIFDHRLLSPAEHADLIQSADCGLVMYKHGGSRYENKNLEYIGLSSGKFSNYAGLGLPIVAVKQSAYKELALNYKFGEVVDDLDEIPAAAKRLVSRKAFHQAEARRLFAEKLDFNVHWPALRDALAALVGRRPRNSS